MFCSMASVANASELHDSAKIGDAIKINNLLENGADVNAKAINGYTALMCAMAKGHTEVVNLLKQAGAKE